MTKRIQSPRAVYQRALAFRRDQRGTSAVEFAIVSLPFFLVLLAILQMGIFYMTQSALNAGVIATTDSLVNTFYSATSAPTVTNSYLAGLVTAKGGGLITSSNLIVDLEPFSDLTATALPITATSNIGVPRNLLSLRAQASVTSFMPGFASLLVVRSSSVVRRQGY